MITVLVPMYNCADRIMETVNSLAGVCESEVRAIFLDNCSTDGTCELVKAGIGRSNCLELIESTEHCGRIENWNRLLRIAEERKLTAVIFLMAGDRVRIDGIEKAAKLVENHCKASVAQRLVLFSPVIVETRSGISSVRRTGGAHATRESVLRRLFLRGIPFFGPLQSNVFVRGDGVWPVFDVHYDGYFADQKFVFEFMNEKVDVCILDEAVSFFNQKHGRFHNSKSIMQRLFGDLRFVSDCYIKEFGVPPGGIVKIRWFAFDLTRYCIGVLRGAV